MKDDQIQFLEEKNVTNKKPGLLLRPTHTRGESFRNDVSNRKSGGPTAFYVGSTTATSEDINMDWCVEAAPGAAPSTVHDHESAPEDLKDMLRMGKQQEMRRVFRQYSLISFQCLCLGTWEYVLLNNYEGLLNGGTAGLFWSYVWSFVGTFFIAASIAEMSSMAPTSGAQYHWVSEFAGQRYQAFLSYMTGWMATLSWQCNNASGVVLVGLLIQAIIYLYNPDYTAPSWHTVIATLPCVLFVIFFNIFGGRVLPVLQNVGMVIHVLGLVALLVVFWVLSPHVPAERALMQFQNSGGYPKLGLALMVGQLNASFSLSCSDAPCHMAEEVRDAGVTVPRAIINSLWISGAMGFLVVITFVLCTPDTTAALNTPSGFSFLYIMQLSIPNGATAVILGMLITIMLISDVAFAAATTRSTFAFARDKGLPFWPWIAKVNQSRLLPVNAVLLTATMSVMLSLIYLGSDTAFNSIVTLGQATQSMSYMISISCVLYRRIKSPARLPKARWNLGRRRGVVVNVLAILYSFNIFVWSFLPPSLPTEPETYNLTSAVFAATVVLALVTYYLKARKEFVGPVVHTRLVPTWNTSHQGTEQNLQFLTGIDEE